jgi:hypothetical protein
MILGDASNHWGLTFVEVKTPEPSADNLTALYRAGLEFEANGAIELAGQNYRQALELLKPGDKENFKALHYRLGRVAEALGKCEDAESHYNQVDASD